MRVVRPKYKNFSPGEYPSEAEFDLVELKYDGWFLRLDITEGEYKMYSRSSRILKEGEFPSKTTSTIYAEFLFGTEWSKDRDDLYGRLAVFGAETINGRDAKDLSNDHVRDLLSEFIRYYSDTHPLDKSFLVEQYPILEAKEVWAKYVVGEKYEGLVFKNSFGTWGDSFGRMKADTTIDYVCLGFEESDSDTYVGWGVACVHGGLYVNGQLQRVCKISGLTNDLRKEFFDNPDKYIGRVFEAKGKRVTKKGALRHPDFIRWRDDKLKEECTWTR